MMLANLSPLYMPSAKPQLRRKSRAAKQRCLELPTPFFNLQLRSQAIHKRVDI